MKSTDTTDSIVYLSLSASTMVTSKHVHLEDVASIFCSNPEIAHNIKKISLFTFHDNEQGQLVVTAMSIIEHIAQLYRHIPVQTLGSAECVVYYRNLSPAHRQNGKIKAIFLLLLAFFGTAYSIMSYNGDVGAIDLLQSLYQMFTGSETITTSGYRFGILAYCIGLFCGMLVFFNHGLHHRKTDDPTPLQVQMRLYERDVNDTIVVNSERKGTSLDVD